MKRTAKRLDQAYKNALCLPIHKGSRIVMMSDCHRGVGNWGDNFLANQNLFFAALQYYNQRKFTYIELGDGDELWENRDLQEILQIHNNQFCLMGQFYCSGRLHMLYGNLKSGNYAVLCYSNCGRVAMYSDGILFEYKSGEEEFYFQEIPARTPTIMLTAEGEGCCETLSIHKSFTK